MLYVGIGVVGAPTNVHATYRNSDDSISVSWDFPTDENIVVEYKIFINGDDGSQRVEELSVTNTPNITVEGLSKCVDYTVGVMAVSLYNYSDITYNDNILRASKIPFHLSL